MSDVDDAIKTVLRGLSEVEAAPGLEERMERRVRHALRQGAEVDGGVLWSWPRARWRRAAVSLVAVAGVVGALAMHWERDRARPGGRTSLSQVAEGRPGGTELVLPRRMPAFRATESGGLRQARRAVRPGNAGGSGTGVARGAGAGNVSFPAPPMPLTEEEKLLLEVVHHTAPEQVEVLDPASRAQEEVAETTAFLGFFGRPMPVADSVQPVEQGEHK